MTDHAGLAAALETFDEYTPAAWSPFIVDLAGAARERLAQLPEKCEHGELEPHSEEHWSGPLKGAGFQCSGKVYPAELVERIAFALFAEAVANKQLARDRWDGTFKERPLPEQLKVVYRRRTVAVLDALNGETE